jgi:two-component system, chemotaxis family, chemotaxis protein CheY
MSDNDVRACRVGIALVEDEQDLVKIFTKAFTKKGIQICFIAFDGLEAVKKYMECEPKPHTIIMDYRLPIMDGIAATKEIIRLDSTAKIIFLSADIQVKEDAMRAGAFMFLKKPVSIKTITDAVESAIYKTVV